jgi:hypothetical protein
MEDNDVGMSAGEREGAGGGSQFEIFRHIKS